MNESLSCRNCQNRGLWEMVTSGTPFGYSGDIPCLRCSKFSDTEDNYIPKNSQQIIEAEPSATDNTGKPEMPDMFSVVSEVSRWLEEKAKHPLGGVTRVDLIEYTYKVIARHFGCA